MSRARKRARQSRLEQRATGDGGAERHPEVLLGNTPAPSQDARLIARAIRQNWDIPPTVFKKLPQQVLAIFEKKKEGTRERLRAAELILKMHGQNEGNKSESNDKKPQGGSMQTTTLAELLARERAKIQSTYLPPSETEALPKMESPDELPASPPDDHAHGHDQHA